MKLKKAEKNLTISQKFSDLKVIQAEKPDFQIIAEKIEAINAFFVGQNFNEGLSIDHCTHCNNPDLN